MKIQKSSEDYLEAMLILREKLGYIRSVDIAKALNVKKPSVTYATKRLRENNYIEMDKSGAITLTEKGFKIADNMYRRHKVLTEALLKLGLPESIATEDACKLEHDLSEETFRAIYEHTVK